LVELERDLQDERLLAEAEVHRGVSLIHTGQVAQAIPVLEAAIEGAERIGDLHTLCTAMDFAAYCYYSQRDLERTMRYRERIVEVAEQLGDPFEISYRTVEASYVTFLIGDWRRSREFAERGLTARLSSNNLQPFLQPLYTLGELSLYEGKWEEATTRLGAEPHRAKADDAMEAAGRLQRR
jgi:tetratricopeptide (TPR) repeat protein